MREKSPCGECGLRLIDDAEQLERCRTFVQDVIHQWWSGNPTLELRDVVMDNYSTIRDWGEDERHQMDECFVEHSSARCDSLNP